MSRSTEVSREAGRPGRVSAAVVVLWACMAAAGSAAGHGELAALRRVALARERGDHAGAALAALDEARVRATSGDPADTDAVWAASRTDLRAAGSPQAAAVCAAQWSNVLQELGRFDRALELGRWAVRAGRATGAADASVHDSLSAVAGAAWRRGDLSVAGAVYDRVLDLVRRRQDPEPMVVAVALNNVGIVAGERGDYATAEARYRQCLRLIQRIDPDDPRVAGVYNNLGAVATYRKDPVAAEHYFRRALEVVESTGGSALRIVLALNNLAAAVRELGDLEGAEELLRRALTSLEEAAPGHPMTAQLLAGLATVAGSRGDLASATALAGDALELAEAQAPQSLFSAGLLHQLGANELDAGNLDEAERLARQALAIRERLAPGSWAVAETLYVLGLVGLERGDRDSARAHLARAVHTLESQTTRLGGSSQQRAAFRASQLPIYRALIRLLLEEGDRAGAFSVLERSRAQGLLELLAERDLVFTGEVPTQLDLERRQLGRRYDQVQARLGALTADADPDSVDAAREELEEVRRDLAEVHRRIRQASPRLGELRYPEPVDAVEAQVALDSGTVMLSYSVGPESTTLFVLDHGGRLEVAEIAAGEGALRRQVGMLRRRLQEGPVSDRDEAMTRQLAERLYSELVAPADEAIRGARRLLVVPDGPLHVLPFGVLVRPEDGSYLVEGLPIHVAASATVFRELSSRRTERSGAEPGAEVVAFGDPDYRSEVSEGGVPSRAGVVGRWRLGGLEPLPATRAEVGAVAAVFGDRARVVVGSAVTEERVKALAPTAAVVHLACHGLFDEAMPLDSGLALSVPRRLGTAGDNGLLQAWEVFEEVRLSADLVVLSACESGLGALVAGEGLVGITRAFQFAGARTVVASLWRVADLSTAELMASFYRNLEGGMSTDRALRAAQLELLRGPVQVTREGHQVWLDLSHPIHWAGFQVVGDWF